ncbi:MAG: ATPase [Chitinophagaceae bacterium]|nr:MAG: ATPase [Chitinophagaceae bacterium]
MAINKSLVRIEAPIERVWECVSNADLVREWQYGSNLDTSWEPGTGIRFSTPWEGKTFEQWGTVEAYNAPNFLAYRLFAPRPGLEDKPENYFRMEYRLQELDGTTELEISQVDERPGAEQEKPQGEENPMLQALKKLAERR